MNIHRNFLDSSNVQFAGVRSVLDAKMKSLVKAGVGTTTKQADPITIEDEDNMWAKGIFGCSSSESLLHTVFFYASKIFGLRGCDEHHDLKAEQFDIGADPSRGKYIHFHGRSSKTFTGGLGQLNLTSKDIKHYCEDGKYRYILIYNPISVYVVVCG